jgi:hypothetical protein
LRKGIKQAANDLKAFGANIRGLESQVVGLGLIAGGAAAAGLWQMSKGAIALGEQTNRAGIDFGGFSGEVIDQSKLMATAYGMSRKEFLASASSFAQTFTAAKYGAEDVSSLSVAMVKLAADMSSKVHIPIEEALSKLQSGLAGQARPLHTLGIFMSDDAVKAYAVAQGIAKLGVELTESQKIQARTGFIMQQSAKFLGNLGATADSAGNLTRSLSGRIENLSDTMGTALNTIVGPAISELTVLIQAMQTAWESTALAGLAASSGLMEGAAVQVESVGWIQKSIMFVVDAWQAVRLGFLLVQSTVTMGVAGLVAALGYLGKALDFIAAKFGKKLGIGDFFDTWQKDLEVLADTQLKKFSIELAKPAASEGIADAFARAKAAIAGARAELAKPGIDVSKLKPKAAAAKAEPLKFADAISAGSKEAANLELKARFGGAGRGTPESETARNTRMMVELLSKLLAKSGGAPASAESAKAASAAMAFGLF